ncbi:Signal peptidase I [Candidatus Sulfopaludibacter sp. SbA3]|nr:Signal peptidase I [Candidatus Sulfopaludibacter sp. SbA3]
MTPASAPRAIAVGAGVAFALCGLLLAAALWNPTACLPFALLFLVVALGIRHRIAWRAFGGALLLAAAAGTGTVSLLRNRAAGIPWVSLAVAWLFVAALAWLLYRAGRAMRDAARSGSPAAWISLACLVFVFPQVMQPYVMATGSMEHTLSPGDYMLVRPVAGSAVSRGEVVQIRYPIDPKQLWIKRVVAVGGDRLHFHDKALILNGVPVEEPFVIHSTSYLDSFRDNFPATPNSPLPGNWAEELQRHVVNGELTVPAGAFFVLGDNRDDSLDSRYFGFVDQSYIVGKPVVTYFSAQYPAGKPYPVLLHPSAIRWPRMFRTF